MQTCQKETETIKCSSYVHFQFQYQRKRRFPQKRRMLIKSFLGTKYDYFLNLNLFCNSHENLSSFQTKLNKQINTRSTEEQILINFNNLQEVRLILTKLLICLKQIQFYLYFKYHSKQHLRKDLGRFKNMFSKTRI